MKKKVLVVDDSIFMQRLISRLIEEDEELQVAGTARNGLEAVEAVRRDKPDVITLDIEMPIMNGLEALKLMMAEHPVPVVMLSSLTREGADATLEALRIGAVDFIPKPSGAISMDLYQVKDELIAKVKAAAGSKIRSFAFPQRTSDARIGSKLQRRENHGHGNITQIVAIGTSTGGPKALEAVITALPADFAHPVLVVQHMPPKFTQSLAQRLDKQSHVRVVEATHDEQIEGGTVYIAPGSYHMTAVRRGGQLRIALHQQPPRNGHRPSVDVMFESVTMLTDVKKHYVLMTGMGSDGAAAMEEAKRQGAVTTIAESEETCVVYGMPKSAIDKHCVDYIVPVHQIANKLTEITGGGIHS